MKKGTTKKMVIKIYVRDSRNAVGRCDIRCDFKAENCTPRTENLGLEIYRSIESTVNGLNDIKVKPSGVKSNADR